MANNEYISLQVKKIVEDDSFEFPLNLAMASAWIIANFKGINIKIFNMKNVSSLADYFILASASNATQARAIVETIDIELKKNGRPAISVEGLEDCEWVLLDHGDVMVHVFQESSRDVYNLDQLWAKREQVAIPSEFYFQSPEAKDEIAQAVAEREYF